jgi:hypothetical protein
VSESFKLWIPLHRLCIADFGQYGNFPAVYAIRECSTRDILKYGHTVQIRQRIFVNLICGWGGSGPESTTQRVFLKLHEDRMIECVEISWIQMKSKEEAAQMEKNFRKAYMDAHGGQRPVWDRQD